MKSSDYVERINEKNTDREFRFGDFVKAETPQHLADSVAINQPAV
jgi:hypothetical protein